MNARSMIPAVLLLTVILGANGCDNKEKPAAVPAASNVSASPAVAEAPAVSGKAVITREKATFWFPVASTSKEWQWQVSAANAQEYSWMAILPGGSSNYEIGFSLFRNERMPAGKGSLAELLRAGQVNVWRTVPEGGAEVVEGVAGLSASHEDDGVKIELADPDMLKKLHEAKPAEVRFETNGGLLEPHSEKVIVKYE